MKLGDLLNGTVTIDEVIDHVTKRCQDLAEYARKQAEAGAKDPPDTVAELVAYAVAKHDPDVN